MDNSNIFVAMTEIVLWFKKGRHVIMSWVVLFWFDVDRMNAHLRSS